MSRLKTYRTLKETREFSFVYHNAKKFHTASVIVFYRKSPEKKIGFTASKKVGNAVARNFAKRRMRASFVAFSEELAEGTYLFVAKKEIGEIPYKTLQKSLNNAFKRLGVLLS